MDDAQSLIDRKMQLVAKSIESIENIGNTKRKNLEQIMGVMQYKLQQQEQMGASG